MNFENLSPVLSDALTARGYEALTPVQTQVSEDNAKGRDLLVSAQTGSGKTVAFGLAMGDELLEDGRMPFATSPLALIIAPTRELALQVSRELSWLYAKAGARIATCVGGMDASKERRALGQGVQIVVGTPGRLRDHLERGALDLTALRVAVLDEADEMLDMGFRDDLEEILDGTPATRRTLLFSATIPGQIVQLAKRYQHDALRISTVGDEQRPWRHRLSGRHRLALPTSKVRWSTCSVSTMPKPRCCSAPRATMCVVCTPAWSNAVSPRSLCRASIARTSATPRCKRCAIAAPRFASRPTSPRAVWTCPTLGLVIHVEIPRDAEALQHRSGRTGRAGERAPRSSSSPIRAAAASTACCAAHGSKPNGWTPPPPPTCASAIRNG